MVLYICAVPHPTKEQEKGQLVTLLPRSPTIVKDYETVTGISQAILQSAECISYVLHIFLDDDYEIQNYASQGGTEK